MDLQAYETFTSTLIDSLEKDPAVIGLVALGSMARQDYPPDRWSDHDFFVITHSGEQERFRQEPGWLPDPEKIVLHFRETEHGVKVLYAAGHLLEFAVFDVQELRLARLNRYRVLIDQGGVAEAVQAIAQATTHQVESEASSDLFLIGQFLTNLFVGLGRHRRGEQLSGRQLVKSYALQHLLRLLARHLSPPGADRLDNLDPFRRFEAAYPQLGQELNVLLNAETPQAVRGLLDLAERELKPYLPDYPTAAAAAVRQQLQD